MKLFYIAIVSIIAFIQSALHAEPFTTTEKEIVIENTQFSYTTTSGFLTLDGKNDSLKAKIFFISYQKKDVSEKRPLTFCFNGGPGSSSIWLHIGFAGPKIIHSSEPMTFSPSLDNNENSLLDLTDLVFIDPVSTGYSAPLDSQEEKNFHGVCNDVKYLAAFISAYLSQFNRWDSPRFLMGESYGTLRAASLANYLHSELFIGVNGLVLLSPVLNFQTIDAEPGNDLPYSLFLPSYAAVAWYHQKLSNTSLEKAIHAAKSFAQNEYLTALFRGDTLTEKEKKEIANKLSLLIGLSPSYIYKSNLRISPFHFSKELLREEGLTVGRFDGAYTSYSSSLIEERLTGCLLPDPSFAAIANAFTSSFNHYLKNDLLVEEKERYMIFNNVWPWNWNSSNGYVNVSESLFNVVVQGKGAHVFVANGYFDIATPFFASEYTFDHLGIPSSLSNRITIENYPGGHMMYLDKTILAKLKKDITKFYKNSIEE